jgi:hypothetical protein
MKFFHPSTVFMLVVVRRARRLWGQPTYSPIRAGGAATVFDIIVNRTVPRNPVRHTLMCSRSVPKL